MTAAVLEAVRRPAMWPFLEEPIAHADANVTPLRARQLAVVAWISAIGLMSALSMTASGGTGFVHPTNTLLGVITER